MHKEKEKRIQTLNSPNHARQSQYKIYSNKLNILIRTLINKSKRKSSLPNTFNNGNKTLSDPLEIANQFFEYFTDVGPNLAKQTPLVDIAFNSFLTGRISETIFIYPTDITELSNTCQSFKSGKSDGSDDITMDIIKNRLNL